MKSNESAYNSAHSAALVAVVVSLVLVAITVGREVFQGVRGDMFAGVALGALLCSAANLIAVTWASSRAQDEDRERTALRYAYAQAQLQQKKAGYDYSSYSSAKGDSDFALRA